jgi:hypothetical protein
MGIDMVAINEARRELLEKFKTASTEPSTSPFRTKLTDLGPVGSTSFAVSSSEVFANIIRSGVGPVSEFDIEHAGSANGKIVSFNPFRTKLTDLGPVGSTSFAVSSSSFSRLRFSRSSRPVAAVGNNEVFANIIRSGVGPVSEFDIEHAGSANSH